MRRSQGIHGRLGFALEDERPLGVVGGLGAHMLHLAMVAVAQVVESQAIPVGIDKFYQFVPDQAALRGVQDTLKDRALHALTVAHADLGLPAQTRPDGGGRGVDIVGDEDQHDPSPFHVTGDHDPLGKVAVI